MRTIENGFLTIEILDFFTYVFGAISPQLEYGTLEKGVINTN